MASNSRAGWRSGSNEAIKQAVAGGLGVTVMSQHTLSLEPMQGQLTVLDVEGFPIMLAWYAVYPGNKQLSVVAQAFFEYLKTEAHLHAAGTVARRRGTRSSPRLPDRAAALRPMRLG